MLTFYLIRHAECFANLFPEEHNRIIGGRHDSQLTENGIGQATSLGRWLNEKNINFDCVYSSVALRAQNTAQIVCSQVGYSKEDIHLDY
jgi:broad specificity phosphatase PhoE